MSMFQSLFVVFVALIPHTGSAASAEESERSYPVDPSGMVSLEVIAAFTGDAESIEENPRLEIFHQLGQTSPKLPSRQISFVDSAGTPVGQSIVYSMPFKTQHTYRDAFYTPPGAIRMKVRLVSGVDSRLVVSQVELNTVENDDTLNVNPDFGLGLANYSGWQRIASGGKLIERDGKTVLDTKYGSVGQRIPLKETGTYALSAIATGNGYNSVVSVRVYDAEDHELLKVSTRKYGPPTYFVIPENAAYASLLVYSCLLEQVRLERVGDEHAIKRLP